MPVQLSVKIDTKKAQKRLGALADELQRSAKEPIRKAMYRALARIIAYPPPFTGPYPWKSAKQRRYVMWAIRAGVIKVPYERTYRYYRGWKVKELKDDKVGYQLTGRAVQKGRDYTKYVGGSGYGTMQARIHQKRWSLARDVIDEEVAKLPQQVGEFVRQVTRKQGWSA